MVCYRPEWVWGCSSQRDMEVIMQSFIEKLNCSLGRMCQLHCECSNSPLCSLVGCVRVGTKSEELVNLQIVTFEETVHKCLAHGAWSGGREPRRIMALPSKYLALSLSPGVPRMQCFSYPAVSVITWAFSTAVGVPMVTPSSTWRPLQTRVSKPRDTQEYLWYQELNCGHPHAGVYLWTLVLVLQSWPKRILSS